MTSSRLIFSLLVLGCVVTQSFAMPQRVKRSESEEEARKNQEAGDGTPEGILKAPENTRSYSNWGNSNFGGVQNIMDGHFMKKKKEGDQVTKYGDRSRKENEQMQKKIEVSQQHTMADTFKYTNEEMIHAIKDMASARQRSGEAPSGGGGGGGHHAKDDHHDSGPSKRAFDDDDK